MVAKTENLTCQLEGLMRCACFNGFFELFNMLVEEGVNITKEAIFGAVCTNRVDIVKKMIDMGIDINQYNNEIISYFSQVGSFNHWMNLIYMEEYIMKEYENIKIESQDKLKDELRQLAEERVLKRYLDMLRLLLENGADYTVDNYVLLRNIIRYSYPEAMDILIENGLDVSKIDTDIFLNANYQAAKKLIRLKNITDDDIYTIFYRAIKKQKTDIVKMLVEKGLDVTAHDNNAIIILSETTYYCEDIIKNLVDVLVEAGADVTARNNQAVINATKKYNSKVLKVLIEKGADVQAQNNRALLIFCREIEPTYLPVNSKETLKVLLNEGVDVTVNDNEPLYLATQKGNLDLAKALIKSGAKITDKILRKAIICKDSLLIELFINSGINIRKIKKMAKQEKISSKLLLEVYYKNI